MERFEQNKEINSGQHDHLPLKASYVCTFARACEIGKTERIVSGMGSIRKREGTFLESKFNRKMDFWSAEGVVCARGNVWVLDVLWCGARNIVYVYSVVRCNVIELVGRGAVLSGVIRTVRE